MNGCHSCPVECKTELDPRLHLRHFGAHETREESVLVHGYRIIQVRSRAPVRQLRYVPLCGMEIDRLAHRRAPASDDTDHALEARVIDEVQILVPARDKVALAVSPVNL